MNESSVSSPFMKLLRAELLGSVVTKHHDASMIGLPDCSVTWKKKIAWLEFKLIVPPRYKHVDPLAIILESPTQHAMMCRLGLQAHAAWYLMWVKKSKRIIVFDPLKGLTIFECQTTPELVQYVSECLHAL